MGRIQAFSFSGWVLLILHPFSRLLSEPPSLQCSLNFLVPLLHSAWPFFFFFWMCFEVISSVPLKAKTRVFPQKKTVVLVIQNKRAYTNSTAFKANNLKRFSGAPGFLEAWFSFYSFYFLRNAFKQLSENKENRIIAVLSGFKAPTPCNTVDFFFLTEAGVQKRNE